MQKSPRVVLRTHRRATMETYGQIDMATESRRMGSTSCAFRTRFSPALLSLRRSVLSLTRVMRPVVVPSHSSLRKSLPGRASPTLDALIAAFSARSLCFRRWFDFTIFKRGMEGYAVLTCQSCCCSRPGPRKSQGSFRPRLGAGFDATFSPAAVGPHSAYFYCSL